MRYKITVNPLPSGTGYNFWLHGQAPAQMILHIGAGRDAIREGLQISVPGFTAEHWTQIDTAMDASDDSRAKEPVVLEVADDSRVESV
jgi:hypothetical protein